MAHKFTPNIILIDLMSSDIDAQHLCGYVRQCEDLQDCAIIALAGGLSENEAVNLQNRGFDAVVTDTGNMNHVLSRIQDSCAVLN